jgi:CheY-like chemotaxis protein
LGFSLVSDPHLARLCVSSDSSFSECREDAVILRLVPFLSAPLVNGAKPILRAPYLHSDLLTSLRSLLSEQSLADWMHSPRQHHLKTAPFHNLNIRLLVVEDSLINQKVIGAMLRSIRLKFDLVNDGAEAVDLFTKSTYDLILMDVHMPKMDGYEATRRIRALPNGSDCVIIALSAGVLQEQEEKALALGMDAFLSKPVTVEDIRAVVARFFSSGATANLAPGKDFII